MKRLLLLLLITFSLGAYAQEQEPASKSKTIAFLSKDGSLLKKEYYDIEGGKVSGVDFQNIIITDEITKEKVGALRIATSYYSSALKNSETFIGTLDYDELDACIKSLEYMNDNIIRKIPDTYTECEYSSRDGIRMNVFWSSKKKWAFMIQTKSYTNRSTQYLDITSLPVVIINLKNSQVQLKETLAIQPK